MRTFIGVAGLALVSGAAMAQQLVDSTFAFQPGDVVRFHSKGESYPDIVTEVLRCHDFGDKLKYGCVVRERSPRAGREQDMWLDIYSSDYNEITLLSRGQPATAAVTPNRQVQTRPDQPRAAQAAAAAPQRPINAPTPVATNGQCPGPLADASRAPAFNATTARWAIYDNYAALARRNALNSPIAVGVTFESLTLGQSEPNAVLNDPGRGAYLKNDAAPRGTTLYSVASVYRVCERYANAVRIARYEARHVCFRNAQGEWSCGIDGFPKRVSIQ